MSSPDAHWPHGAFAATYEQPDGCECCGDSLCRGECEQDNAAEVRVAARAALALTEVALATESKRGESK